MRECYAQPALLAAPCHTGCNACVCVADRYTLYMKTARWTQHRYNIVSVMQGMDAVCVNAMRIPHCLLHLARLDVMPVFV